MSETPIIEFSVDPAVIQPGGCATLRWRVEGVQAVYVFAEGQHWREHGVVGAGEQQVCPAQTTTYRLRVIHRDGSAEVRTVEVRVQDQAPVVQEFAADRTEIRAGECVTFRWRVEGVKEVYFHREDNPWQGHGVAGVAEAQRCPSGTATFCLRVVRRDDVVEVHRITIQVK